MDIKNRKFLEQPEMVNYWHLLREVDVMSHISMSDRKTLLKIAQEEFDPKYSTDLWCSDCCANLLRYVYTQYGKVLASESADRISEKEIEGDEVFQGNDEKNEVAGNVDLITLNTELAEDTFKEESKDLPTEGDNEENTSIIKSTERINQEARFERLQAENNTDNVSSNLIAPTIVEKESEKHDGSATIEKKDEQVAKPEKKKRGRKPKGHNQNN